METMENSISQNVDLKQMVDIQENWFIENQVVL